MQKMFKINKILFICGAVLAAVQGQVRDIASYGIASDRSDDYVKMNHDQYSRYISEFDHEIETFQQHYKGRLESLNMQGPFIIDNVVQMEEHINPLELMGDVSHKCVVKYRHLVPTVAATKASLVACFAQATNELPNLVKDLLNYRNSMFNYFNTYFQAETTKCDTSLQKGSTNHSVCITTVTKNTNANVVTFKKTFGNMMDVAECSAKAFLKRAVDCFLTVQTSINSQIAESKISINNCLMGKDEICKPCPVVCGDTWDLLVDYKNETMKNPFYGAKSHSGCLLLKLK